MKKAVLISGLIMLIGASIYGLTRNNMKATKNLAGVKAQPDSAFMEGDIIFQTSQSQQCKAVKLATHSEYSHVGMIMFVNGKPVVLEAVEPVRITPVQEWIAHGNGSHYTLMRMKNRKTEILDSEIEASRVVAKKFLGVHYDLYFNWSDDQLYCSELVWKMYKRCYGVELCSLRKMQDFDLTSPEVKAIMKQRYGSKPPLEEDVVAPSDLSNSTLLYVVEKK